MSNTVSTYTPVTTSGQINFAGLGNGTDFNQLITKLVQVEQGRITTLQTWKQSWTDKQAAFQELNTELLALKTSLEGMRRRDFLLLALLVPALGAGCDRGEKPIRIDLSKRRETTVHLPPRDITYAYLPQYAHTVSYERHRLLLDYLGRATGLVFHQLFPDTFEQHVRMALTVKMAQRSRHFF